MSVVAEEFEYIFTLTNKGNVDNKNVKLNDPMLGGDIKLDKNNLKPGESTNVTVKHKITEDEFKYSTITNKAIASGLTPSNELIYDQDEVVVDTLPNVEVAAPQGNIINEINGKGGYRVLDIGETFAFDTKVRINKGKNIDKFVVATNVDKRLSVESVDVTIDNDVLVSVSNEEVKALQAGKSELELDLNNLTNELDSL